MILFFPCAGAQARRRTHAWTGAQAHAYVCAYACGHPYVCMERLPFRALWQFERIKKARFRAGKGIKKARWLGGLVCVLRSFI